MVNRKLVFAAACLGMLIFGIVMTTLGAILPSIIEKFDIDKINAGSLMSLMSFGILTGSLVFGPIVDRYGYKTLLVICASLILIGLEGIAFSRTLSLLRLSVLIIGLGGGVINGGTNVLIADISEEQRSANLSILGVFFGLGAIGIPFLLGILLKHLSFEIIIAGVGMFVLFPIGLFIVLRFPVPKQSQGFPLKQGLSLIKELSLILLGFILFFESGMEITVGSWITTFLKEELTIDMNRAVFFLSFYWLGMVCARIVLGFLLKKIAPTIVLIASIGIAMVGSVTMILAYNQVLTITGIVLIGIGFAAVFPVILGYVGDLFPALSGTAFSIVFVMALTGGMIVPFLTGLAADSVGLRSSFMLIPCCLIGIIILFSLFNKRIK